jgi:murein DD-endopeptidase MepM/ murein hydrolase activator NlpD
MHTRYSPTFEYEDTVTKGSIIGRVGNSGLDANGNSYPIHLHFEASNSDGVFTPGDSREERITMRVNPRYFYPVDAFTGEAESVNYSSITIWDEIIPKRYRRKR